MIWATSLLDWIIAFESWANKLLQRSSTSLVAAAAAKSLQSCLTLCDLIDDSLPQILYRWATGEVFDSSLPQVRNGTFYLYLFALALSPISSLGSSAVDILTRACLVAQAVKNLPAMQETWVRSLGWQDSLEKGMATHSSILAWRIPWTKEPGRLRSMGLQRVTHDWVINTNYICKSCLC